LITKINIPRWTVSKTSKIYREVRHLQQTYITYMLPYRSDGHVMKANDKSGITITEMKFKRPTS